MFEALGRRDAFQDVAQPSEGGQAVGLGGFDDAVEIGRDLGPDLEALNSPFLRSFTKRGMVFSATQLSISIGIMLGF